MSEIKSTFRSALDRLKEFPGFLFTCAGASYYEWIETCCPDMFEEIRQFVKEGRWVIVNGWYLQPDCNIPCGESFARHALYSQRYYLEKFGVMCDIGYNVDSFGHSGMLPQILKKSGMDSYVFMRPGTHENPNIPELSVWESADGSQVRCFRISNYAINLPDHFDWWHKHMDEAAEKAGMPLMVFYGVGNHGGGPTIALLNHIEKMQKENPHLIYSSPSHYAKAMEKYDLPIWKGDLQIHAIGCYSAMLEIKQWNRLAETSLLSAEKMGAVSNMLLGTPQKKDKLQDAWKRVMFNHFHDLMCGCSIKEVYTDARASYGYAQNIANDLNNLAAQQISWNIDTLGDANLPCNKDNTFVLWGFADRGSPIVLFNPMPFPVEQVVTIAKHMTSITDSEGNEVMHQRVRSTQTGNEAPWNTVFTAKLPAMGYATYWAHMGDYTQKDNDVLSIGEWNMSNEHVSVEIDPETGFIKSIKCLDTGREYLKDLGAVPIIIEENHSDTWGHGLFEYRDVIGRFEFQKAEWMDRGPVRATLRLYFTYGESLLEQDIILERGGKFIDLRMKLNWREKHKMLKLEFPVNADNATLTAEIPYGTINRPMDGTEKPIQRWVDVSNAEAGFAVVNDSNYAVDVKDSVIRMTVLRSPIYADHFGREANMRDSSSIFTEQGEREVRFRIIPHAGDWRKAEVLQHAYRLNTPIYTIYETYHKGKLPQCAAGIRISEPGIIATVLKEAEDGGAYILRCHEAYGLDTAGVSIELPQIGRTFNADFGHYEIKTFRIPMDAAQPIDEVNLLEL